MNVIIPAILPQSRADLEDKLFKLHGLVHAVQVDVVDGIFAAPPSWPYSNAETHPPHPMDDSFPYLGEITYDVDLMVAEPETVIGHWVQAGATRITVHAESSSMLPKIIDDFQVKYGHRKDFALDLLSFGLALNVNSDIALVEPFLDQCDYIQFMGIDTIGRQGQPFDKRVLAKISAFRKKYPDMFIQVDGGVTLDTAAELLSAGVSRLVVGSALWNAPDVRAELQKFKAVARSYGMYT